MTSGGREDKITRRQNKQTQLGEKFREWKGETRQDLENDRRRFDALGVTQSSHAICTRTKRRRRTITGRKKEYQHEGNKKRLKENKKTEPREGGMKQ